MQRIVAAAATMNWTKSDMAMDRVGLFQRFPKRRNFGLTGFEPATS